MRSFLSVFALSARATLFKILGIIAIMTAVETGILYSSFQDIDAVTTLGAALPSSSLHIAFALAFALMFLVLYSFGNAQGSTRPVLTLSRLSVGRKTAAAAASLYAVCCFTILWAVQVVIIVIYSFFYTSLAATAAYTPALLLATYDNRFLYSLFAADDLLIAAKNILFVIGAGLAAGQHLVIEKQRVVSIMTLLLLAVFLVSFPVIEPGTLGIGWLCGPALICIQLPFYIMKEEAPDENMELEGGVSS